MSCPRRTIARATSATTHLPPRIVSLRGMGLAGAGAGVTPTEACRPAYLAAADLTIALFAVGTTEPRAQVGDGAIQTYAYVAPGDEPGWRELLGPAIADARRTADVVLVMPHFRASFRSEPDPADRAASQLIIDLGADAVIASGAHEFQGIEVRNGRPIVHNAGSAPVQLSRARRIVGLPPDSRPGGRRADQVGATHPRTRLDAPRDPGRGRRDPRGRRLPFARLRNDDHRGPRRLGATISRPA